MSEALSSNVAAQTVAALKRENAFLHKSLAEVYQENQSLRKHVFHISSMLDVAVNMLNSQGIVMEPPIDLRALRAELKASAAMDAPPSRTVVPSLSRSEQGEGAPRGGTQRSSTSSRRFRVQAEIKEHTRAVHCAAFAPDEGTPLIATGSMDRRVVVSNYHTGAKQCAFEGHDENVSDVAWLSPSHLLSCSFDSFVKLWDVSTATATVNQKTAVQTFATFGYVLGCTAVLNYGTSFAAVDSKRWVHLHDTRGGKPPLSWQCTARASCISYDPSTSTIITGHTKGQVALWDLRMISQQGPSSCSTTTLHADPLSVDLDTTSRSVSVTAADQTTDALNHNSHHQTNSSSSGSGSGHPQQHGGSPMRPAAIDQSAIASSSGGAVAPYLQWKNDASQCAVTSLTHCSTREGSALLVVSDDNMVRLYGAKDAAKQQGYSIQQVISGIVSRTYTVRGAYWQGLRDARGSMFDEADWDPATRRLRECDLVVVGGGETYASVIDITEGQPSLLQRLEGHKGRVTGAVLHPNETKPIVATTSEDSCVKIWVPSK